jgi:hypothetical protein
MIVEGRMLEIVTSSCREGKSCVGTWEFSFELHSFVGHEPNIITII